MRWSRLRARCFDFDSKSMTHVAWPTPFTVNAFEKNGPTLSWAIPPLGCFRLLDVRVLFAPLRFCNEKFWRSRTSIANFLLEFVLCDVYAVALLPFNKIMLVNDLPPIVYASFSGRSPAIQLPLKYTSIKRYSIGTNPRPCVAMALLIFTE
jgi:hypothetical protein